MHIKHQILYVFCTKYWSSMVYRGWTIGCAVQCTVYSVFYSVCWDTVLAQLFVVIRCTLYVVQVLWCPVHGVRCVLQYVWCGIC